MMKFQVTFEANNDDDLEDDAFVEGVEAEVEGLLADEGFSNVECKVV